MPKILTAKALKYVAITIVLGAVGSGAWEWLLKPMLALLSKFGLDVATLGIKTFKDLLYADVAQGFHEGPSVTVYFALFGMLPSFLLGVAYSALRKRGSTDETSSIDRFVQRTFRPVLYLSLFALVVSIVRANQVSYINRAVTNFYQLRAITAPYQSDSELRKIDSEFAQISSSEDYSRVVSGLRELCNKQSLKCPAFPIW